MDSPFLYNKPLVAGELIGREAETNWAASNLSKGLNCLFWENAKMGKTSLINNVVMQLQKSDTHYLICCISCYNVRSLESLNALIANQLITNSASTLSQWEEMVAHLLPASRPQIQVDRHKEKAYSLIFDSPLDKNALNELSVFPQLLTDYLQRPILIVLESFHNVLSFNAKHAEQEHLMQLWKHFKGVSFLIAGCGALPYRELFDYKKPWYRFAERIPFEPLDEKTFTDFIIKNFSKAGRVITRDYANAIFENAKGHPYYVQQFAAICYTNTKGYMNDAMFDNACEDILNCNQSQFELICQDLSTAQLHYLRALTDGIEQFSSKEVLLTYNLNSSANVQRVREALEKKQVIEIIRKKPRFIDPVFEIWYRDRFLKTYWL